MISSEVFSLYWSPILTGRIDIKVVLEITLSPTKSILFMELAKLCIEKNRETRKTNLMILFFMMLASSGQIFASYQSEIMLSLK